MRKGHLWLLIAVVAAGAVGVALRYASDSRARTVRPAAPPGRDVLAGTDPRDADLAPLERMAWADVAPTLDAIGRDAAARKRVVAETAATTHPPLRYLRGLLLVAQGNAEAAATVFAALPAAEIPVEHLYAPYRLLQTQTVAAGNPFRTPLRQAVTAGAVTPLVAARVLGREGDLPGALQAFLRSDPGQWATQDLEVLAALRWHSGLAGETITLLKAALKSGRVSASLRPPLLALVTQEGERAGRERLNARVAEALQPASPLRATFLAAAETQLQVRERFLQRDYAALTATYRTTDAGSLPDETLLLLVLSSAQLRTPVEFERWSRELKRRFPDPSVSAWLQTLLPPPSR